MRKNNIFGPFCHQIYQLRKDRRYMVQTPAQYSYVYKCVYEYLSLKKTELTRDQ